VKLPDDSKLSGFWSSATTKSNWNCYQSENSEFKSALVLFNIGNGRLKNISIINRKNTKMNVRQFV